MTQSKDNPEGMRIITMYQPWASFVLYGWKTIETRRHSRFKSLVGKRIGIHAGLEFDDYWRDTAEKYLSPERLEIMRNMLDDIKASKGKILCTVLVNEAMWLSGNDSKEALIDCSTGGRFGLFLGDMETIEPTILATGKQGIWIYKK